MFSKSLALISFALLFAVTYVQADDDDHACTGFAHLRPKHHHCVCEDPHTHQVKPFKQGCEAFLAHFYGLEFCIPHCHHPHPSHHPHAKKRKELVLGADGDVSPCPKPQTGCPIFISPEQRRTLQAGDFECTNLKTDMDNCGGCTSLGQGESCADIPGVKGTACVEGKCQIYSCSGGYKRVTNPHTHKQSCVPIAF